MRHDLGKNGQLTEAARDKLCILRAEIKDNDSLMRHAKCHYYNFVRSSVLAVNIILSAVLFGTAAPAAVRPSRIDALPLANIWTKSIDGPAPLAAAATADRLVAGWADHLDVFRVDTGEKEWGVPIPIAHAACEAAFCVVADGRSVRGIDLTRRLVSWQRSLDAPLGRTPTLRSGWVILASDAGLVRALQASDGREVWTYNAGAALTGAASVNGNQVAIANTAAAVTLLDLANGKPLWTVQLEHATGAPRLGGGRVLVGTDNGQLVILDAFDGKTQFTTRTGGNVTGAPSLDEKHIYTVGLDGVLRAFDRGNGAQRWYSNLATRAADGPFVDGDLVFVPLRTGAIDVRLHDGKAAVHLPAPGTATTRLPMAPLFAGAGSTLSLVTISYDLNDVGKWSLIRYSSGARLTTTARPARIPGLALTLTAPR